jgi:hypothetical protein
MEGGEAEAVAGGVGTEHLGALPQASGPDSSVQQTMFEFSGRSAAGIDFLAAALALRRRLVPSSSADDGGLILDRPVLELSA